MKSVVFCLLMFIAASSHAETLNPGDMTKQVSPDQAVMNMKDIHDIASLMPASGIPGWAVIAASLVAAVVVAIASYLVWKRFGKQSAEITAKPVLPWIEAIRRLDSLSRDMATCSAKDFYFSVSEILRRYISGRFSIDAMEMTAEELKPMIEKLLSGSMDEDGGLRLGLKSFLGRSDVIKFGKDEHGGAFMDQFKMEDEIRLMKRFVNATIPIEDGSDKISGSENHAFNGSC